jgi:uncharacterized repeat protein (TIGR03803 family)
MPRCLPIAAAIWLAAAPPPLRAANLQTLASLGPLPAPVFPTGALAMGRHNVIYGASSQGGALGLGTAFLLAPPVPPATAWRTTVIHSFAIAEGIRPGGGLTPGAGGTLFGTTYTGGPHGNGTVFALTPNGPGWTETTLFGFTGGPDGGAPLGTLLVTARGTLLGTTTLGGANNTGTIFALTPPATSGAPWTQAVLASLPTIQTGRGVYPYGGLVRSRAGILYGTTQEGGAHGCGAVFQLAPGNGGASWTLAWLHDFNCGTEGGLPVATLLLNGAGALTGTTTAANFQPLGTVFRLTPPPHGAAGWSFQTLFAFGNGATGAMPAGPLATDAAGALYGATAQGGANGFGLVFKLTPHANPASAWAETVLHSFAGPDGAIPAAVAGFSPRALVGTTRGGGAADAGTVFWLAR